MKQRKRTVEEKFAIVMEGLKGQKTVSAKVGEVQVYQVHDKFKVSWAYLVIVLNWYTKKIFGWICI